MKTPKKKYLIVVDMATREVVRKVDVTGKNEREIDKVERGLLRNMDTDKYYVDSEG